MKILISFIVLLLHFNLYADCVDPVTCLEEVKGLSLEQEVSNNCNQSKTTESDNSELLVEPVTEETKLQLDSNWWKYTLGGLAMAPPAFLLGTAIHELSHCAAAEAYGFDCFDVRLFPYKAKYLNEEGEVEEYFYFASMSYRWDEGNPPTPGQKAMITAAPMFTDAGLITVFSTLAFMDKLPKNKWAKTATFVLGAVPVFDMINHARNTHERSDSGKLVKYFKENRGYSNAGAFWVVKGPQIGMALIGTSALVLEGVRLFTNPVKKQNNLNISVTPTMSVNGGGFTIQGKF